MYQYISALGVLDNPPNSQMTPLFSAGRNDPSSLILFKIHPNNCIMLFLHLNLQNCNYETIIILRT